MYYVACVYEMFSKQYSKKTGILVEQNEQQQQKKTSFKVLNINITQKLNLTFEFH